MKIEISEVFVTHADAITSHADPTPTGIAALDSRLTPVAPNTKRRPFSRCLGIFRLLSLLFT